LSGEKALHVFRMLQEIIHNSAKHGKAKRLRVSAEIREKKLLIRTSEDGIGFKLDPKAKTLGLGLQNLEMRARIVGGKLVTDTGIGRGTRYTIEIPLEKN
jgi:signal transduction histidine kinase